jgi:hypothetical protein
MKGDQPTERSETKDHSMSMRRPSASLWRNKAFLVYFFMLSLLALLMFGSFMWSLTQNRMIKDMLRVQEGRMEEQVRRTELAGAVMRADGLVIVEGRYQQALEAYEAIVDDLPPDQQDMVRKRMERIMGTMAEKVIDDTAFDPRDMLLGQYRRTIEELELQAVSHKGRISSLTDSLQNRIESLMAEMARKEKALGSREKVQVISFKSPKGYTIHYLGEVQDGKAHGGGVGIWSTGSVYRGDWRNNLRHGQGTFEWADGERYEGTYVDGIREGQGTYYWPSGDRYEGAWKGDRRNGQGTLYDMDGSIRFQGHWKDDKPVDP